MKNYIHTGLGFPVIILNPKMTEVFGEQILDINSKHLQQLVFEFLLSADFRFSGAHIKFIRHMMGFTQAKLAELLWQANHSCVSQWEGKDQALAGMEAGTEKLLKMLMASHLNKIPLLNEVARKSLPINHTKKGKSDIKLKIA